MARQKRKAVSPVGSPPAAKVPATAIAMEPLKNSPSTSIAGSSFDLPNDLLFDLPGMQSQGSSSGSFLQIRPWMQPDFYLSPDTQNADSTLWIRRWKNPATLCNEIHWMRENINQNSGSMQSLPSRQKVSYFEVPTLISIINGMIKEIESIPERGKLPRFMRDPAVAALWNKKQPEFWTPGITELIPSETLKVRPYQSKTGIFFICILYPKNYKEGTHSLGTNVVMTMSTSKEFVKILDKIQVEIEMEEIARTSNLNM